LTDSNTGDRIQAITAVSPQKPKNNMRKPDLQLKNVLLDTGLRFIVGAVFLVAGISKLPLQPEWVESWTAGIILPSSLIIPYISALPYIEIVVGSCLILGLFTKLFSAISIPIIASFIVGNLMALSYDAGCGCFGVIIEINHKWALVIDALLFIGAVVIFFRRRRFMTLDSRLSHLFKVHLSKRKAVSS